METGGQVHISNNRVSYERQVLIITILSLYVIQLHAQELPSPPPLSPETTGVAAAAPQIVFYRNRDGHVLVKFLVNEKETLLRGLEPMQGPYYEWSVVRENLDGWRR